MRLWPEPTGPEKPYDIPMSILKLRITALILLLNAVFLPAQNLGPQDELYLCDPEPRLHGDQVRELQRSLAFFGMDIGSDGIDSWFGADTDRALREYQNERNLNRTGRISIQDIPPIPMWWPASESTRDTVNEKDIPESAYSGTSINSSGLDSLTVTSRFGSIDIPVLKGGYTRDGFLLSPDSRFIVSHSVHPADSQDAVSLWDIVSGQSFTFFAEEALLDEGYQGLRQGFTSPRIHDFYWISDDRLCIVVTAVEDSDGPVKGLIIVRPGEQHE